MGARKLWEGKEGRLGREGKKLLFVICVLVVFCLTSDRRDGRRVVVGGMRGLEGGGVT